MGSTADWIVTVSTAAGPRRRTRNASETTAQSDAHGRRPICGLDCDDTDKSSGPCASFMTLALRADAACSAATATQAERNELSFSKEANGSYENVLFMIVTLFKV